MISLGQIPLNPPFIKGRGWYVQSFRGVPS
jgi:hypothetical protein